MAIDIPDTSLSTNDIRILNALFDPETLPSAARSKDASEIDSSLPAHPTISSSQVSKLEAQQNDLVRRVNSASSVVEIEDALKQEDAIAKVWPEYPSVYINLAMLHRMKLETLLTESQTVFSAPEIEVQGLFDDLSQAIKSCGLASSTSQVSPYQARILRTAFSHRAYLYLKASETGVEWDGKSKSELEELASTDFAAAARYGDEVAREMSVRTNPYAKMCGAIVKNALREERALKR
ncbi:hypothetical protein K458DRAFT_384761 [Lentithecium fluviatile CBS 122367]|uniref:Uncharacterized protein n=1 Tax=Lentithecium fluviatile CBS 122367 TaxID=1168545 RepID=A0A6G1JEM6_9PLEO|nr:hypothetical protein K458DRAFT_384761 [Lentithecium fluviatile CBS 122367]